MLTVVNAIIGIGTNKKKAEIWQKKLNKTTYVRIGVGLTKQWEPEYILYFHTIPRHYAESLGVLFDQECIFIENIKTRKCKIVFMEAKKEDKLLLGIILEQRRAGNIDSLLNKNIADKLLKAEKVENLTTVDFFNGGKSYSVLKLVGGK